MRPIPGNHLHIPRIRRRTITRLTPQLTPAQQLRHQPILDIRETPRSTKLIVLRQVRVVVSRQEHIPQPELSSPLFQVVEDGSVSVPAFVSDPRLRRVDAVRGDDFFVDPFLDRVEFLLRLSGDEGCDDGRDALRRWESGRRVGGGGEGWGVGHVWWKLYK